MYGKIKGVQYVEGVKLSHIISRFEECSKVDVIGTFEGADYW